MYIYVVVADTEHQTNLMSALGRGTCVKCQLGQKKNRTDSREPRAHAFSYVHVTHTCYSRVSKTL